MAQFCEALAETGVVLDACLAVGKSANTAYSNRRRDPLFAGMWEAALGIARNRLADALLARSIEGSVEYYYRDGVLVGEKRHIDNNLGLAVLRRLDRLFETGSTLPAHANVPAARAITAVRSERSRGTPALDWDQMIGALRTREPGAMAAALAALKAHEGGEMPETHETHDPPERVGCDAADDPETAAIPVFDPDQIYSGRVWRNRDEWWTNYPPPPGYKGIEHGKWGTRSYERSCSDSEFATLTGLDKLEHAAERAAEEVKCTAYFAELAEELAEAKAAAAKARAAAAEAPSPTKASAPAKANAPAEPQPKKRKVT